MAADAGHWLFSRCPADIQFPFDPKRLIRGCFNPIHAMRLGRGYSFDLDQQPVCEQS
jgi:hypothetical protein